MSVFNRRHFFQYATSTLAAIGLSQWHLQRQGLRYARSLAQPTRRKRALLVGINQYPDSKRFTNLRGCVTDVQGASHLGQFTQTAWESNAKLGKVLGTYGNED